MPFRPPTPNLYSSGKCPSAPYVRFSDPKPSNLTLPCSQTPLPNVKCSSPCDTHAANVRFHHADPHPDPKLPLTLDGDVVATLNGESIPVPLAIPGETVEVEVHENRRGTKTGVVTRVIHPSSPHRCPHRVEPPESQYPSPSPSPARP